MVLVHRSDVVGLDPCENEREKQCQSGSSLNHIAPEIAGVIDADNFVASLQIRVVSLARPEPPSRE